MLNFLLYHVSFQVINVLVIKILGYICTNDNICIRRAERKDMCTAPSGKP